MKMIEKTNKNKRNKKCKGCQKRKGKIRKRGGK